MTKREHASCSPHATQFQFHPICLSCILYDADIPIFECVSQQRKNVGVHFVAFLPFWPFCLRPVSEADAEGLGTTFLTTFGQCIYFTF
jgi:hypothetical protein